MTLRAALSDALLTTLAAPTTWPMGLATFLLRGGVILVALPIVVLPSPVGLGNILAPTLMEVAFQGVTPAIAALVGVLVGAFVAWVVLGGLVAGALEAASTSIVLREDVLAPPQAEQALAPTGSLVPARILGARVIAHVPTAMAFIWGSTRLGAVAYRELTSPLDVATPIVLRVIGGAPEAVAVTAALWAVGEIAGAIAVRGIVTRDEGVLKALQGALYAIARRPIEVLCAFGIPLAGLLIVLLPAGLAASASWTAVQVALQRPDELLWATLLVVAFVGLWAVGLGLLAVMSAWRAAVWTLLGPRPGSRLLTRPVREPG